MLIIVLLIITLCCFLLIHICRNPYVFTFAKGTTGPTLLIVGNTHGDEVAGYHACNLLIQLLKDGRFTFSTGKIIIVPSANPCGRWRNTRRVPIDNYDINRNYSEPITKPINKQISELALKSDWILDMHEGWGFRNITSPYTVGSGVYPGKTLDAQTMARYLTNKINKSSFVNHCAKRFLTEEYDDKTEPIGTLSRFANDHNINYILVETTGLYHQQPLEVRVHQHLYMALNIIALLMNPQ